MHIDAGDQSPDGVHRFLPRIGGRGASLAPLYDLMCAAAWENVTKNLSQTIAGKDRGDHVKGRHWQRMADECGFNRTMILRRIEAVAERVRRELPEAVGAVGAMPGGDHPLLGEFAAAIEARCRTVVLNLAHVEADAEDEEQDVRAQRRRGDK